MNKPVKVARVLADGQTQLQQFQYNARGARIRTVDPLGRETVYVYGTNNIPDANPTTGDGIDLLQVKQANSGAPGGYDLLSSYTYNANHQTLTSTDTSGQTTTYTYTPSGEVQTVTNAKNETTTYSYYPNGALHTVTGPVAGTTTTYEYDGHGRLWRVTDPEGYATLTEYDLFDRPTKVSYPDGTWEETVYERLDAVKRKDRQGRWAQTFHDALGRPIAVKDAAGRMVQQQHGWEYDTLVDANGNKTTWQRDILGRVVVEERANGAQSQYAYDPSAGQLLSVADPKGNVKTSSYNLDGTLAGVGYTVAAGTAPTPNVSFTYDPVYNRVATMTDGTGATSYTYYSVTDPPTLGAGKLKNVDGPLVNDTIEYGYDELGRVVTRQIGSAANTQTQAFDPLGRLTSLTNPLGSFTYSYDGNTGRPASLTYPNGQQTTWSYYDNLGDHRLREIHNKRPGGATLSRFEYTYDTAGNILTWLQQADSDPPKVYHLGYDPVDQLKSAILKSTDPIPVTLKRYYYSYDPAGNRTAEQIDDAVTSASYNNMNQLVSQQAGGALVFKGTVSEPASVTVGGKPATVTADNRFEGQAVVPGGTGQVAVSATDPSGNVRTSTYQVSQGTTSKSFTYDLNGNMTSDGTRTFEWDAENRLVALKEGEVTVASYGYNYRRLRTSKTVNGSSIRYVLDRKSIVEERSGTSEVVRYIQGPGLDNALGFVSSAGSATMLTRDHLGSIREWTTANGAVLDRRADYDPFGHPDVAWAAAGAFTGREYDSESGLHYYRARYYDTRLGRFLSEDPAREQRGYGLYGYVGNAPTLWTDPLGLRITVRSQRLPTSYAGPLSCNLQGGCTMLTSPVAYELDNKCTPTGNCFKFDVRVMPRVRFEFDMPLDTPSQDTPGATIEEHEELHARDIEAGLSESALNAGIQTEKFKTRKACEDARVLFPTALQRVVNEVLEQSHQRDRHD
jgi:RHS repeat-associated protein